jgi:hypothetical protein
MMRILILAVMVMATVWTVWGQAASQGTAYTRDLLRAKTVAEAWAKLEINPTNAVGVANVLSTNSSAGVTNLINTLGTNVATLMTEQPGRTNTVVDGSVGLELGRAIIDKLDAGTNVFKVLVFGDSLGGFDLGAAGTGVHQWLLTWFGHAGSAGRSTDASGFAELIAASVGANPAGVNQEAGTNWWSLWHSATNGATVRWNNASGNGINADTVGLYWIKWPGGGSFDLQISTNGGTYATIATCDGYSATRTVGYTNFARALNPYKLQVATSSGTNLFIGPELYNSASAGVVGFYVFKGGAHLGQMPNIDRTVWDGVMTNYNPDLVMYNMVDGPDTGLVNFENNFNNNLAPVLAMATNATVWLTGCGFKGAADDYLFAQENDVLRRIALANGYIFTDTRFDQQSWERSVALGYMVGGADVVHYVRNGAQALGKSALRKIGLVVPRRVGTLQGTFSGDGAALAGVVDATAVHAGDNVALGSISATRMGIGGTNSVTAAGGLYIDMLGQQRMLLSSIGSGLSGLWLGLSAPLPDFYNYAILGHEGLTYINAKAGARLSFRINNVEGAYMTNTAALWLAGGVRTGSGDPNPIGAPTNSTAPGNAATPKAWVNFTNATGGVFKLPLYQ